MNNDQWEYVLASRYDYDGRSKTWNAVICKQPRDHASKIQVEVIAFGVEHSEEAILIWLRESIKLMRETGRTDVSVPDSLERAVLDKNRVRH